MKDCDCTICAYAKKHPQIGTKRCWHVTPESITDKQIRDLFLADEIAAIELTVATLPGWSAEDRHEMRSKCAEIFNARGQA